MKQQPIVIFEDNHLLGLVKPCSWLSQGDETGDATILDWGKKYIKIRYNKPSNVYLQCVHRLDRPTSGVMIYARTSKVVPRLAKAFRDRKVSKTYFAITKKKPPHIEEQLVHFLKKNNKSNTVSTSRNASSKGKGYKESLLSYELVGNLNNQFLLKIHIETGRSHQIRAQLSDIGCPILGDIKYGADAPLDNMGIGLHCYDLNFQHPVKIEEHVRLTHKPLDDNNWSQFMSFIK